VLDRYAHSLLMIIMPSPLQIWKQIRGFVSLFTCDAWKLGEWHSQPRACHMTPEMLPPPPSLTPPVATKDLQWSWRLRMGLVGLVLPIITNMMGLLWPFVGMATFEKQYRGFHRALM